MNHLRPRPLPLSTTSTTSTTAIDAEPIFDFVDGGGCAWRSLEAGPLVDVVDVVDGGGCAGRSLEAGPLVDVVDVVDGGGCAGRIDERKAGSFRFGMRAGPWWSVPTAGNSNPDVSLATVNLY